MAINVRVLGLPELQRKLGPGFDAAIEKSVERIGDELLKRHNRSKGVGARNNPLDGNSQGKEYTLTSSLNNPRQTGTALVRKNTGITKRMAPRVIRKRLEEAWSA